MGWCNGVRTVTSWESEGQIPVLITVQISLREFISAQGGSSECPEFGKRDREPMCTRNSKNRWSGIEGFRAKDSPGKMAILALVFQAAGDSCLPLVYVGTDTGNNRKVLGCPSPVRRQVQCRLLHRYRTSTCLISIVNDLFILQNDWEQKERGKCNLSTMLIFHI